MNVINIVIDSLNRHYLSSYGGNTPTPNLDKLAQRSWIFDNHFIGAAPCMPARRELMTGRKEMFWRGWGVIEPFDKHIATIAAESGATTAIITDHYHYWEMPCHGYFEMFQCAKLIRGQEVDFDNMMTFDKLPKWSENIKERGRPAFADLHYKNAVNLKTEEDFPSPKTFAEACDWVDNNHSREKFFLWVEPFDVHEPFHVPEPYRSMFTNESEDNNFTCWPPYQEGFHGHNENFWNTTSDAEIEYIRSQYKGKLAMLDKWLGKLLDKIDKYNLWNNTAIILTTDHGHELGEKERFGKQPPMYDESARIPLFIYHPEYKPANRINAFTTAVDIYATVIDILETPNKSAPHGKSLMPLIKGETDMHRSANIYGWFGAGVTITNSEYTYHCSWDPSKPLNWYSASYPFIQDNITSGYFMPDVKAPLWKLPRLSETPPLPEMLFNRKSDPSQQHNIAEENPKICLEMKKLLRKLMTEEGVPSEQFERLML